jgi:hypothetical protein
MLILPKAKTISNAKKLSIEEEVLKLASRPDGVTREEATWITRRDIYKVFQRLRRADLIRPGTNQRKSLAGKSIDIFFAVD